MKPILRPLRVIAELAEERDHLDDQLADAVPLGAARSQELVRDRRDARRVRAGRPTQVRSEDLRVEDCSSSAVRGLCVPWLDD